MKYILLIALQISAFAFLRTEPIEYKDEPIEKHFVDSEYQCTAKQLNEASKQFMKCDNTPVFRDCYAKMIRKHCTRKFF